MEETIITSVQNARIKHVVALQQKSALRREEGLFVVEGQREIEHCIACGYEIVELFYLTGGQAPREVSSAVCEVSPAVYEKMAYRGSTEGIIAVARSKSHRLEDLQLKENPLVVVLESVEKPGNQRGIRILTAQLQDSYEYYDYDMRRATAIVMGTESTGLTDQWRQAADAHIRIPMLGRLDSLNVSVSAAILMYEAVRQRNSKYQTFNSIM